VAGVDGFESFRYEAEWKAATNASRPPVVVGQMVVEVTGLATGTEHEFRVKAVDPDDGADNSEWPALARAAPLDGPTEKIAAPELNLTPGAGSILASRSEMPFATGYELAWRKTGETSDGPKTLSTGGASLPLGGRRNELSGSAGYDFRVRALNSDDEMKNSD